MRPLTERMQRALDVAFLSRDGVAVTRRPQAKGLVERGLGRIKSVDTTLGWTIFQANEAGFALAAHDKYAQQLRDQDHAAALAECHREISSEIVLGSVVGYHGSHTDEHGSTYVVQGLPSLFVAGWTIFDRDYPWFTLSNVRRTSITPTGEVAALCERCRHEYTYCSRGSVGICVVSQCWCIEHTAPEGK